MKHDVIIGIDPAFRKGGFWIAIVDYSERSIVFERFVRLDEARTADRGTGLGLAIVDRVVQKHHGRLEIKNRDGGGLAVRVWLTAS